MPPRYSSETAYSHYFFEFENERLFEKYITHGFIDEKTMKIESFRSLGVQRLIEDRSWMSTISNIPRFVTKVVYEFYANLSNNIVVQRDPQCEKSLLGVMSMSFPLEPFVSTSTFQSLKILILKRNICLMMLQQSCYAISVCGHKLMSLG